MKRMAFLGMLLWCCACASPQEQEYHPAQHPPLLIKKELVTNDKVKLPVHSALPQRKVKAVIVALHGFNDYSDAFTIPSNELTQHGIAVYAYDQRGFGRAVNTGVWAGQDNLTQDAADMVRAVHKRYPHAPLYLLGESMGGAVAVAASVRPDFPHVDGIILSAPALWGGDTMNPFFRGSLWLLAHSFPEKVLTGEDLRILASDNIEMLRALSVDPLVIKGARVDAVYGLVHLMDTAYSNIGKVKEPILILYGAHDEVVPPEPIRKSIPKITAPHVFGYYMSGYHMLLRDKHRDIPLRDIISWIDNKQKSLPSGADAEGQKFLRE